MQILRAIVLYLCDVLYLQLIIAPKASVSKPLRVL